jgi:hypothetical protein
MAEENERAAQVELNFLKFLPISITLNVVINRSRVRFSSNSIFSIVHKTIPIQNPFYTVGRFNGECPFQAAALPILLSSLVGHGTID